MEIFKACMGITVYSEVEEDDLGRRISQEKEKTAMPPIKSDFHDAFLAFACEEKITLLGFQIRMLIQGLMNVKAVSLQELLRPGDDLPEAVEVGLEISSHAQLDVLVLTPSRSFNSATTEPLLQAPKDD